MRKNLSSINYGFTLLLVFIFINISVDTLSQNTNKIDSLLKELNRAEEDSNKVNIYIQLTDLNRLTDKRCITADSLINIAEQGLILAQKLDYKKKIAVFYFHIGAANVYNLEYDTSFYFFNKALSILKKNEDILLESKVYLYGGIGFFYSKDYQGALEWYNKSLELARKVNNKFYIAQNLNNIGSTYDHMNEYEKAVHYFHKSMKVAEEMGDSLLIGRELSQIGHFYWHNRKNNKKALEYYERALKCYRPYGYSLLLANVLNNMGIILDEQGQTQKAIEYSEEALAIQKRLNRYSSSAATQNYLGLYYAKLGYYEKANEVLNSNREYFKRIEDKQREINTLYYLGELYMNWGKYKEALEAYQTGYELSTKEERKYPLVEFYLGISSSYEKLNNYEQAHEYYKKYHKLNDSLFNEKMNKQISELEIRYETEKKEQQIELQEAKLAQQTIKIKQQKLQKNSLIGGLSAVTIVIFILGYAYDQKKRSNSKIREQNKEIEKQADDLKGSNIILQQQALSAQINPHFIFNTLNSIQYFVYENNKEASNKYLNRFSKLMRLILDNSQQQNVLIKKELEVLELYLDLELLRFGNKFEYTINCDEETSEYRIPALLLQPYVENAVLHGISNKENGKGKIDINIKIEHEILLCSIDDNGIGREASRAIREQRKGMQHQSLGTKITKKRLDITSNLYNKEMRVKYIDKYDDEGNPEGTRVEITLPLII